MYLYVCVAAMLLGTAYQVRGLPLADPADALLELDEREQPVVSLYHHQICQKAVTRVSNDMGLSKRDDALLNLVINVCLPDVTDDTVLQLLDLLTNTQSQQSSTTTSPPWDAGLLPEIGAGQEGEEDIGGGVIEGTTEEAPELIGGLPAETGPGQEGVNPGEDTDNPDNDTWWDGAFPDIDLQTEAPVNDDELPPSWSKKDMKFFEIIAALLDYLNDDINSDSSSSSEEESDIPITPNAENPTTESPAPEQTTDLVFTTEAPVPTTEAAVPSTAKQTTQSPTTEGIATTLPPVQPNRKNMGQGEDTNRRLNDLLRRLLLELNKKR